MGTPAGMRCITFRLENGDKVLVYSDSTRIFLQLRHGTPTGPADQDILTPSFKVAVSLTDGAALALASELLSIVASNLKAPPASQNEEHESEKIQKDQAGASIDQDQRESNNNGYANLDASPLLCISTHLIEIRDYRAATTVHTREDQDQPDGAG